MKPALTVAAAFALFAFLHSLTVSGRFKVSVRNVMGERWMRAWYRLSFTVFSAIITALFVIVYLGQPDLFLFRPGFFVLWAMHAVQFAGVLLMLAAMRQFDMGFFTGLAQSGRYMKTGETAGDVEGMPPGGLVTSGVYGLVRHPMYLAGILVLAFEPNVTVNCLVVRVMACGYFVYGALVEESRLTREFGGEYRKYMKSVPMFNIIAGMMSKCCLLARRP